MPDAQALPDDWQVWAEEPAHGVRVEEDGALLGVVHAAIVGPGEAWLEGLWVKASVRGRGVGRHLVTEAEALVRRYGATTVRTATPARDYAALAVAEHSGFVRHSEATVWVSEVSAGPVEAPYEAPVAPARVGDAGAIMEVLIGGPDLSGWRGLVPLGWRFRRLVPELVRGLIQEGRVLVSGRPVVGVALFALRGDAAVVSAVVGPAAHRQALFGAVAEGAAGSGATRLALFTPERVPEGIRTAFRPHPWCPDGLTVVERRLAGA
jgi:GNAT superfamily N-acetyltransferase